MKSATEFLQEARQRVLEQIIARRALAPSRTSDRLREAIDRFCVERSVLSILESHGVAMRKVGAAWHTVNGCPLPGCGSVNDAFRVHPDRRSRGDGPQWICRRCARYGDALSLAVWLSGDDPTRPGATSSYLKERGLLEPDTGSRDVLRRHDSVEATEADVLLERNPRPIPVWVFSELPDTQDAREYWQERVAFLECEGVARPVAIRQALAEYLKMIE